MTTRQSLWIYLFPRGKHDWSPEDMRHIATSHQSAISEELAAAADRLVELERKKKVFSAWPRDVDDSTILAGIEYNIRYTKDRIAKLKTGDLDDAGLDKRIQKVQADCRAGIPHYGVGHEAMR